jgi:hypothetical protein
MTNRTPGILLSSTLLAASASLLGGCAPVDADALDGELTASSSAALASPITWRGSSVKALDQATGPGTSIAVAKPAGTVSGDVEVAVVASYRWVTVTAPSGWTLVKAQTDTGTIANAGVGTSVFVRVAGANEPVSYSFALSGSARAVATIQAYANVDTSNPIDVVASAAESASRTTHTTPSVLTTQGGAVLMGIFGVLSPLEPASNTSTMSHERVDRSSGNARSWGVGLAVYDSSPRSTEGSEAGRAAVSSSATDTAAMTLLALRPKAATAETLFGVAFFPRDDARYDEMTTMFGDLGVRRSFDDGNGVSPFLNTYQAQDVAHGAASAYSFKYPPAQVTAGQHDVALRSFFQGIEDNHPVYWTYWHEPDDELYVDRIFTPSAYRAAWAHIKQIANQEKASRPNLEAYATLIIMEYSMWPSNAPSRPLTGPNGMYPGDDVIDVFGVDVYNPAANDGGVGDAAEKFGKVIDFAQQHGKPWAVGELGSCLVSGDPQGRATFITQSVEYWIDRDYPPVYASYFNRDWPKCDYRIDNDAAARQVWRSAVLNGLAAFD